MDVFREFVEYVVDAIFSRLSGGECAFPLRGAHILQKSCDFVLCESSAATTDWLSTLLTRAIGCERPQGESIHNQLVMLPGLKLLLRPGV